MRELPNFSFPILRINPVNRFPLSFPPDRFEDSQPIMDMKYDTKYKHDMDTKHDNGPPEYQSSQPVPGASHVKPHEAISEKPTDRVLKKGAPGLDKYFSIVSLLAEPRYLDHPKRCRHGHPKSRAKVSTRQC